MGDSELLQTQARQSSNCNYFARSGICARQIRMASGTGYVAIDSMNAFFPYLSGKTKAVYIHTRWTIVYVYVLAQGYVNSSALCHNKV